MIAGSKLAEAHSRSVKCCMKEHQQEKRLAELNQTAEKSASKLKKLKKLTETQKHQLE